MPKKVVSRTQTGVRLESSLLKVLKALAEYTDLTLGDLLEGIVLHAFEGKAPFSLETQKVIAQLKSVYGCDLSASDRLSCGVYLETAQASNLGFYERAGFAETGRGSLGSATLWCMYLPHGPR